MAEPAHGTVRTQNFFAPFGKDLYFSSFLFLNMLYSLVLVREKYSIRL